MLKMSAGLSLVLGAKFLPSSNPKLDRSVYFIGSFAKLHPPRPWCQCHPP